MLSFLMWVQEFRVTHTHTITYIAKARENL